MYEDAWDLVKTYKVDTVKMREIEIQYKKKSDYNK